MVLAAQESLHPLTKVLLVDDRVENLLALESLLADLPSQKVQICKAQSGREGRFCFGATRCSDARD
jgi:hypothetical protein